MITELRNGLSVKRFHTTHRVQEETVAHHSANVCAILLRLEPQASRELLIVALTHDVAECWTGDVPAPFKWDNPKGKEALEELEQRYMERHGIPNPKLDVYEKALLKLADMLDLVLSSLEEMGRGNQYAKELVGNGERYIKSLPAYGKYEQQINHMVQEVKSQWDLTINK